MIISCKGDCGHSGSWGDFTFTFSKKEGNQIYITVVCPGCNHEEGFWGEIEKG